MSFANPFRDTLKEDRAREHFESHILDLSPAAQALRDRHAKALGISRKEMEENMFQVWLHDKKIGGFANFHNGAAYEPGY